jgi:hypothetical protein
MFFEVSNDLAGNYLAGVVNGTDDDWVHLKTLLERLIADGQLTKGDYDIGERGLRAFKLGTVADRLPAIDGANNLGVTCGFLEDFLYEESRKAPPA